MLSWMILLYAHMHVDTLISMRHIKMDYVFYPMLKYGGEMNLHHMLFRTKRLYSSYIRSYLFSCHVLEIFVYLIGKGNFKKNKHKKSTTICTYVLMTYWGYIILKNMVFGEVRSIHITAVCNERTLLIFCSYLFFFLVGYFWLENWIWGYSHQSKCFWALVNHACQLINSVFQLLNNNWLPQHITLHFFLDSFFLLFNL